MSTITKEWLQQKIADMEAARDEIPFGLDEDDSKTLAAMNLALASLESEPVAYADLQAFRNFQAGVARREWMWRNPGEDLIAVYTAPPAPVSVPTFEEWCELTERKPVRWVRDAMKEAYDGCRAAMLQGAENAESRCTIQAAPVLDSLPKIAESRCSNPQVIPDCSCRTCRPVTMTDMRFVVCPECGNKRCPHANDHRNACTGSNEPGQEGSAYPAAPQQEVKP